MADSFDEQSDAEFSLLDVLDIYRRHRMLVGWSVLVFLLLGVAASFLPRNYKAVGVLRIEPGTASMFRLSPIMSMMNGEDADKLTSEVEIMQSRTLYLEVARELNLVNNAQFWGKSHMKQQSLDDPYTREKLYRLMKDRIRIQHDSKSEIVEVDVKTVSPLLSAEITNCLINNYIKHMFDMHYGATRRSSGWLMEQLNDLRIQVQNDQEALIGLQQRLGVIGFDTKDSMYLAANQIGELTKSSNEATINRIVAETKYRFLSDSDLNLIETQSPMLASTKTSSTAQNSLLEGLRSSRAQAASVYASLSTQYGPNYPDVKQAKAQLDGIDKEIDTEEKRVLSQARMSFVAAQAAEKSTTAALNRQEGDAFKSTSDLAKFAMLSHDYEAHRTLYEGLVGRLREAGITSGLESGEVDVVDLADLPSIPSPPGPITFIAGGIIIGFIVGSLVALVVDALETSINNAAQVEAILRRPLLGLLPRLDAVHLAERTWDFRYAEAIQSLRSSVLLARADSPPKVIMITSALPAEGKSFTARNLAKAFAQHDARILLIDCDMRRGTVAKSLGISAIAGLSSLLTGQSTLERAVQSVPGIPNLSVVTTGPHPPLPSVLIGSEAMNRLISKCREEYDFIILDSPPLLAITDTMNMVHLADVIVLVARQNISHKQAITEAHARLEIANADVLGFVLNDVDPKWGGYNYVYHDYYGDETKAKGE